jgi:predicted esterase
MFTRTGLLLPILLILITAHSQPHHQTAKTYRYAPFGWDVGFLEFRPAQYGNQSHPLIIFLHGAGEDGDGSPTQLVRLEAAGIPRLIAAGATMKFGSDAFVVLSPQDNNNFNPGGGGSYWKVLAMLQYAKDSLQIDTNRIYITGLSMGGEGTWGAITYDTNVIKKFAAAAPISSIRPTPDGGYCNTAAMHMPIWAFHNIVDDNPYTQPLQQTKYVLDQIIACTNPSISPFPRITYFDTSGHNAWDAAYDTLHRIKAISYTSPFISNATQDTINLFEWFLLHTRSITPPANQPPVADAGSNITITLPTSSVTLNGSGSHDNDGTITTYAWTKISGGSATITSPSATSTTVTGLTQGTYQFKLTVTDNNSATGADTVQVTVNAAAPSGPYYGMDSVLLMGRYALVKRPTEDPNYTTTKKYPLIIEIADQYEYADQAPAGVTALFATGTPKLLQNGVNIYPGDHDGHPIYYIAVKYQPNAFGDLTIPDGFTQMWDTIMTRYPIDTTKDGNGKYKYVMLVGVGKGGATVFNFTNWNPNVGYGGIGSYRALNLKNIATSASYALQGWNDSNLISPAAFARLDNKRLRFFESDPPKSEPYIYTNVVAYSNAEAVQFILTGLTDSQVVDSLYSPYGSSSYTNIYKLLVDDTTTSLVQQPLARPGTTLALTVSDDNAANTLSVYPNPVKDLVNISATAGVKTMELYSVTGKRLSISIAPGSGGSNVQLNMSTLAKGIYFLHITTMDGSTRITKLVKQ